MSQVRITGGMARGRKIQVPNIRGVRPSPDRARTTLFNWLMSFPQQQRVLDLFAGSGILGFEALSRGAQEAHFVDLHKKVCAHLQRLAQQWPQTTSKVHTADTCKWLSHHAQLGPFDMIFLDPPFHQPELLEKCLTLIERHGYCDPQGVIYFERAQHAKVIIPKGFHIHREKKFGAVIGTLLLTNSPDDTNDSAS